jgi:hypothetical protein
MSCFPAFLLVTPPIRASSESHHQGSWCRRGGFSGYGPPPSSAIFSCPLNRCPVFQLSRKAQFTVVYHWLAGRRDEHQPKRECFVSKVLKTCLATCRVTVLRLYFVRNIRITTSLSQDSCQRLSYTIMDACRIGLLPICTPS